MKTSHDFVLPNGSKYWLRCKDGIVISRDTWSETHVRGGNGKVGSEAIERNEFWVKGADGVEDVYRLNVPVTPGQRVSIFWGALEGKEEGVFSAVFNHNQEKLHFLILTNHGSLNSVGYYDGGPWLGILAFIGGVLATIPVGAIGYEIKRVAGAWLAIACLWVPLIWWYVSSNNDQAKHDKQNSMLEALKTKINQVVSELKERNLVVASSGDKEFPTSEVADKYCSACGAKAAEHAKFCGGCGQPLLGT
ncbi:MAG: zinc ribbon domain-containing protein [Rhodocyclaceae bacterium]|nr:zinc ribbon domain-containing protein [Rhodocyclaceae bacterium]